VVNNVQKKVDAFVQKPINRSTTHIRIKKSTKFKLDRLMRKYRCKTYSQMIEKLIGGMQ